MQGVIFTTAVLVLGASAAVAAATPPPATQVQGLTVTGKRPPPLTTCREDNEVCIQAVVTELKLRYPKEFGRWCFDQAMRPFRDEAFVQESGDAQDARFGGFGGTFKENPMARKVCATAEKK